MTVDERVHEALVQIADDIRPAPDPYGRLQTRLRRARRRRAIVAGTGLVAVVAAAVVTITVPRHGGDTIANDPKNPMRSINQWAERSRLAPVRGELGKADPAYVAEVTRLVAQSQRAGAYRVTAPVTEVNVLYLDDVGDLRVAFVAFHLAKPDPTTGWANASAWFVARHGASAAELVASNPGTSDGLDPFETVGGLGLMDGEPQVALALAPEGCVIESAPLPEVNDWTPEPTGDYLVRTKDRAEWWRVVCDGAVRVQQPAYPIKYPGPLTKDQIDAAVKDARVPVDRELATEAISSAYSPNLVTGPTRILWSGTITDAKPSYNSTLNGRATLGATPWARGGWQLNLDVKPPSPDPTGALGGGTYQYTQVDPTDPSTVLPIRLGESVSVLVVVPKGATTVRAVKSGVTTATATVEGLAAVVDAPDDPNLTFEALDAKGAVVATAQIPKDAPLDPDILGW